MLYLTCTMISSVDLAHYRVSRAKDWVPVDCDIKLGEKIGKRKFRSCYSKSVPVIGSILVFKPTGCGGGLNAGGINFPVIPDPWPGSS